MTEKERLLQIRKEMKKRRPPFRRVESWRLIRVKDSWRKSRGIDSKTRRKHKSGITSPSIGYRTPKKIRGLHPSGYEEIRIEKINDLQNVNPKKHAIKIASRLGAKKRLEIIDYAQKRNIKILNVGVSQKELEKFEAMLESPIEDMKEEGEELMEEEDKDLEDISDEDEDLEEEE
jgi:large subunit ribosomal protein L32e